MEVTPGSGFRLYVDEVLIGWGPIHEDQELENVLVLGNASSFENGIAEVDFYIFKQQQ